MRKTRSAPLCGIAIKYAKRARARVLASASVNEQTEISASRARALSSAARDPQKRVSARLKLLRKYFSRDAPRSRLARRSTGLAGAREIALILLTNDVWLVGIPSIALVYPA